SKSGTSVVPCRCRCGFVLIKEFFQRGTPKMKKIAFAVATAAAVSIALMAVPAFAHHPFDAEFDWKKPVTLMGTVTKIGWSNPHAEVSIDARDASGATTHWVLELGNPR